jgi:hypothetical protein
MTVVPNSLWKNRLLLNVLILLFLLTNYYPVIWWLSALGTVLIVAIATVLWKKDFKEFLGLDFSRNSLLITAIATFGVMILSALLFRRLSANNFFLVSSCSSLMYLHIAFNTLNEEMILGSLILNLFTKQLYWLKNLTASILVALFFVLFHFGLSWLALSQMPLMAVTTLLALILLNFTRNNLILLTGHVGFSWALHFGIMVTLFSCTFTVSTTGALLSEANLSDIFFGNGLVFIFLLLAASVTGILLYRKKN